MCYIYIYIYSLREQFSHNFRRRSAHWIFQLPLLLVITRYLSIRGTHTQSGRGGGMPLIFRYLFDFKTRRSIFQGIFVDCWFWLPCLDAKWIRHRELTWGINASFNFILLILIFSWKILVCPMIHNLCVLNYYLKLKF